MGLRPLVTYRCQRIGALSRRRQGSGFHLSQRDRNVAMQELIEFWQSLLCLQTYDLTWSIKELRIDGDTTPDSADLGQYCHAETMAAPDRRLAWMNFHPLIFQDKAYKDPACLSALVAHEMAHVLFCDEVRPLIWEMNEILKGPIHVKAKYQEREHNIQERLIRVLEVAFLDVPVPAKVLKAYERSMG